MVRHGFNRGSVRIQEKKYPVQVPRVCNRDTQKFLSLPVWDNIKNSQEPDQLLLQRMLLGISTRDYEKVIQEAGEGFGVSKSSISKQFIAEAAAAWEEFKNRSLKQNKYVAIFIDGAKGLRAAIETVYGHKAIVQRCVWHKQENVLSYLSEEQKADYKSRIQVCYREGDYKKETRSSNFRHQL